MRYFKNGGLHFIRIGRLQLSVCWCRPKRWVMPEIHDLNALPDRFIQLQRTLMWCGQHDEHVMDWYGYRFDQQLDR